MEGTSMKRKISDVGKKRGDLSNIFRARQCMKMALDTDDKDFYNEQMARLKKTVADMEVA
jgi:hypothetical protein